MNLSIYNTFKKGIYFSINKLRYFKIYFIIQKKVLNKKIKEIKNTDLQITKPLKFNFNPILNDKKDISLRTIKFDLNELNNLKKRLNYLIEYQNNKIVFYIDINCFVNKIQSKFKFYDTYSLSEITINYLIYCISYNIIVSDNILKHLFYNIDKNYSSYYFKNLLTY